MTKILDTIKRIMRKRGIVLKNPVKKPFAKKGACKFIESYDLELQIAEKAAKTAKKNELPHPYDPDSPTI